jgi:hypothetical protein
MRIGIGIRKELKKYDLEYSVGDKVCFSWEEAEKYLKGKSKHVYFTTTKEIFNTFKILERNAALAHEIQKFREKFKITLDFVHANQYLVIPDEEGGYTTLPNFALSKKGIKYLQDILENFNTPKFFNLPILRDLFCFQVISDAPKIANISIVQGFDFVDSLVSIHITSSNVKKNTLLAFIDKNWGKIEEVLSKSQTMEIPYISDRDLRIFDLKQTGKTYRQISNIICKEFPEKDSNYDEATIKTAYQRAKKNISSVFERKHKLP